MADIKIYQSNIKAKEPEDVAKDRARANSYTPPNVKVKISQSTGQAKENEEPHQAPQDTEE